MASPKIQGPGLVYVTSIINKDKKDELPEETFFKWYDDDHIDEIVNTDGIKDAFRYKNVAGSPDKPFLAFYPMADLAFTQGERFRQIRVKSPILPETGIIYDLADIDVRYLGLVETVGNRKGAAPCLVTVGIEPAVNAKDADVVQWLQTEHHAGIMKLPGYVRTTVYRLLYARTNAQSRALKGLPTVDAPSPEPPTCQAIHEFEQVIEGKDLEGIRSAVSCAALLQGAKQIEIASWRLAKAHGSRRFFD